MKKYVIHRLVQGCSDPAPKTLPTSCLSAAVLAPKYLERTQLKRSPGEIKTGRLKPCDSRPWVLWLSPLPTCHEAQREAQLLLGDGVGGELLPGGTQGAAAHQLPPVRTIRREKKLGFRSREES